MLQVPWADDMPVLSKDSRGAAIDVGKGLLGSWHPVNGNGIA